MFLCLSLLLSTALAHTCIHERVQRSVDVQVDAQSYPASYDGTLTTPQQHEKRQTTAATQGLRVYFDTFNLGVSSSLACKTVG